jgi:hypothetical protein
MFTFGFAWRPWWVSSDIPPLCRGGVSSHRRDPDMALSPSLKHLPVTLHGPPRNIVDAAASLYRVYMRTHLRPPLNRNWLAIAQERCCARPRALSDG